MRSALLVLAAGVCLAGLAVEPDGKPLEAVAKPVEYDTLPAEPKCWRSSVLGMSVP